MILDLSYAANEAFLYVWLKLSNGTFFKHKTIISVRINFINRAMIVRMVVYCTGNPGFKRRDFRKCRGGGVINLDNDEILAYFTLDGRGYCVTGNIPFGSFTATEYVVYTRALLGEVPFGVKAARKKLQEVGFKGGKNRKLSRLSPIQYRAASLAAKAEPETRTVYINFDGLPYTYKNRRQIKRFINHAAKRFMLFVAVSDTRFIPKNSTVSVYENDGTVLERADGTAVQNNRTRQIYKHVLSRHLQKKGWKMDLQNAQKIIML